jgi:hypothetical protein
MRLREFAPAGGGDSGNYFKELASAWYNGTFDTGSLQKGIKSQQDVERLLNRGIVAPDGKMRKYHIDYNSDFDGVEIYSDDYYEYGDHDDTIDSRTGQKWGPYDFMAFSDEQLDESAKYRDPKYKGQLYTQEPPDYMDTREYDRAMFNPKPDNYPGRKELPGGGEYDRTDPLVRGAGIGRSGIKNNILDRGKRKGLPSRDQITSLKQSIRDISGRHTRANLPKESVNEFAADDGDSGGEDDALRNYARMWWAGNEATQMQIEAALAKMGWEIGEDEGGYDNGGVFVVRAGDVNGDSYTSWAAEDLTEGVAEGFSTDSELRDKQQFALKHYGNYAREPGEAFDKWVQRSLMHSEKDDEQNAISIKQLQTKISKLEKQMNLLSDDAQGMVEGAPISGDGGAVDNFRQQMANNTELAYQKGMAEAKKKRKKKSSRSLRGYFFPGYGYYGSGESGEGGGDGGGGGESKNRGMAEGSEDPFGPQGRFVGDTGPAQLTTTVPRVQLQIGDRVIYKPTEQRATIVGLSRDGTQARIDVPSPMGGRVFNCKVADLKAPGQGLIREKSTSQAQFRTMAAAAHDPKFARKVGIKPSVAREFNRADRGQSYKSLPKKAD